MNLFILGGGLIVLGFAWSLTAIRAFISDNWLVVLAAETVGLATPCFMIGVGILIAATIQWFVGHTIHVSVN